MIRLISFIGTLTETRNGVGIVTSDLILVQAVEMLNDHLFGKELFILFAASAFRKLSSVYVFSYFPLDFEGRIWDLIVSVPDHCLSFYFP